jgi:uncharacterized membrane protein
MDFGALFPALLSAHVVLAISLFVPAFLLPFTLRTRGRHGEAVSAPANPGPIVRGLLWLETHGTVVIGVGVAVTGVGMLLSLGAGFLLHPWLLTALAIYAAVLLTAFFVQRPEVRRLLRRPDASSPAEQERWRTRARRQRYLSYAMAAAVGLIAWLMMEKPGA